MPDLHRGATGTPEAVLDIPIEAVAPMTDGPGESMRVEVNGTL